MKQTRLGTIFQQYLVASYAYYILNESIMPDIAYDSIAKELLEHWDELEHRHKYLVTKGDLEAGTLYSLSKDKYPSIIKYAAIYQVAEYGKTTNKIA